MTSPVQHESKVDWYETEKASNVMWRASCRCGWHSAGYSTIDGAGGRKRKHDEAVADGTWRPAGAA